MKQWAKSCGERIAAVVAIEVCGHFEEAQNVQCREEIVQLKKACDTLLLKESHVSGRGRKGSRRVESLGREVRTMDFRFMRSIVAKPLPCA